MTEIIPGSLIVGNQAQEVAAQSPFVPGARVAVRYGFSDDYSEAFVEKAYKSGRFTLRGSSQQWRPYQERAYGHDSQPPRWLASKTGDHWDRSLAIFWDETTDAEIRESLALTDRRSRFHAARKQIERMRGDDISEIALAAIEAAISKALSSE